MAKFHINPETGNPGNCIAADGNCPYGADAPHFSSAEDARTAFEASQNGSFIAEAQKITLTKANAKKINVERLSFEVPVDSKVRKEAESFVASLKEADYTKAGKSATVAKINDFMDRLHGYRNLPDSKGIYSRLLYDDIAEKLGVYGFERKAKDKADLLIERKLTMGTAESSSIPMAEYERAHAQLQEYKEVLDKPIEKWTDEEIEAHAETIAKDNAYFRAGRDVTDFKDAMRNRRNNLQNANKRERLLNVWDKLPEEAKDIYSKEELKEQVKELRNRAPFPSFYYGFGNQKRENAISLEENIQASKKSYVYLESNFKARMQRRKDYDNLLREIENLKVRNIS